MSVRNVFVASQIFVFTLIATALYFHFKRRSTHGTGITEVDMNEARARIAELLKRQTSSQSQNNATHNADHRGGAGASPALTSALPSWTANTPPQVILGVPTGSSAKVVEAAYRALVKKYHPDRYSSWGPEYMDRAHEITILLHNAKEALLKTRT